MGKVFAVSVRLMEQCRKRWVKPEERALWHFMDCCEVVCPTLLLLRWRTIFKYVGRDFVGLECDGDSSGRSRKSQGRCVLECHGAVAPKLDKVEERQGVNCTP